MGVGHGMPKQQHSLHLLAIIRRGFYSSGSRILRSLAGTRRLILVEHKKKAVDKRNLSTMNSLTQMEIFLPFLSRILYFSSFKKGTKT